MLNDTITCPRYYDLARVLLTIADRENDWLLYMPFRFQKPSP
jgi:hypothetical protein